MTDSVYSKDTWTAVGLMSGTSMDGIDAALANLDYSGDGLSVELLAFDTVPYPTEIAESLRDVGQLNVDQIARLNFEVGELFADAANMVVERAGMSAANVDVIGSHGQTVSHQPRSLGGAGATMQIGEPAVIAERTGIVTVADFRVNDVAAGGDGAPLVPYFDWLVFGESGRTVAAHNIGGISNVTIVTDNLDDVWAFDTGPGNMPIDCAVRLESGDTAYCDLDGAMAARGTISGPLLDELMRHPYLDIEPPKSTGTAEFGIAFVKAARKMRPALSSDDFVATMTEFVVRAMADAYHRYVFVRNPIDEIVLSGGGARNPQIVRRLEEAVAPVAVTTSDRYGIAPDAKEAVAFAALGVETMRLRAGNVPRATGADHRAILGKIVPCMFGD